MTIPIHTVKRAADLPRWMLEGSPTAELAVERFEKRYGRKPKRVYQLLTPTANWFTIDLIEEGVNK